MRQFILFIFLLNCYSVLFAQIRDSINRKETTTDSFLFMIEGDTVAKPSISLSEIIILPKLKFTSSLEKKKYKILTRKTIKVYPYAKMAADTLTKLVANLENIEKRRFRKRYVKKMQRFMQEKFTNKLKKFSRTEGQILIKLIHRQTGRTMFDLIKDYKSGWRAFWYEKTAHIFDLSLKRKFNPIDVYEDYLIEDILERCFQNEVLVRQPPAIEFNFFELIDKWKIAPSTPIK